jgi:F-type H+-transporting ATPase subunit b
MSAMRGLAAPVALLTAAPAWAAVEGKPFFSLYNTDLVVAIAFVLFIGVLVYFGVPGLIGGMLDKRAQQIRADLDEARKLREEAQELRASFERKRQGVAEQAERIVAKAKADAALAAEQAKVELEATIARRIKAATDQIAAAETAALRQVRNAAVQTAVAAAGDVIAANLSSAQVKAMMDESITAVEARLH